MGLAVGSFNLVQVALYDAFTVGLLGLADAVNVHQPWVDDLYDGVCAI